MRVWNPLRRAYNQGVQDAMDEVKKVRADLYSYMRNPGSNKVEEEVCRELSYIYTQILCKMAARKR